MSAKLCPPIQLLAVMASMIGVKQGCPPSPTLFSLYIDEISNYIDMGSMCGKSTLLTLQYADDIVLSPNLKRNFKVILML